MKTPFSIMWRQVLKHRIQVVDVFKRSKSEGYYLALLAALWTTHQLSLAKRHRPKHFNRQ